MRILLVAMLSLVIVGAASFGQVVISEVGWAGTVASGYDEWIELYNDSDVPIDLSGWALFLGEKEIPLSGVIPAHGFYLMERTDDTTIPGIAAGLIYKGGMANSGIALRLVNPSEITVDTANVGAPDGWWAGDAALNASMERISPEIRDGPVAWRTATEAGTMDAEGNRVRGTPGAENGATAIFLPVSLALPGGQLSGTVELAWEVEGNVEGIEVRLFASTDAGRSWELFAEGLPPVGAFELDTTALANGAVLFALGAFDEGGPRGGDVAAGEIAN